MQRSGNSTFSAAPSLASVLLQIMLLDIVFSLDSVITAVGMALGERMLAARFNRGDHAPIDNHTYFIASDGDIVYFE